MSGWIATFFILTLGAGMMGFAWLTGSSAQIAQFFTVIFVVLFAGSIVYRIVASRNPSAPLP